VDVLIETNHIEDVKKLRVGRLLTIPVAPERPAARDRAFRKPADRRAAPPSGSAADPGPESIDEARALEEDPLQAAEVDEALALGEEHLHSANLDEALEMAIQALRLLEGAPDAPGAGTRLARAEVIVATVHIAYARREAALQSLRRALRADPQLELDPGTTSPKLLRIFEEARSEFD
jgi:tetratricopeptide (TPR) repeat protein